MRKRIAMLLCILIFVFTVPIKSLTYAVPADSVQKCEKTSRSIWNTTGVYVWEDFTGRIVAFIGLAISGKAANPCHFMTSCSLVSYPVYILGTTTGTALIGTGSKPKGSFTGALVGALIASALGTAAVAVALPEGQRGSRTDMDLHALWGASAGAVIGYNYRDLLKFDPCTTVGMLLYCGISGIPYLMYLLGMYMYWRD